MSTVSTVLGISHHVNNELHLAREGVLYNLHRPRTHIMTLHKKTQLGNIFLIKLGLAGGAG